MRIYIAIAPSVPRWLVETLGRCGFTVERCGSGYSLRIGQTRLGFEQVTVRILAGDSSQQDDD